MNYRRAKLNGEKLWQIQIVESNAERKFDESEERLKKQEYERALHEIFGITKNDTSGALSKQSMMCVPLAAVFVSNTNENWS